MERGKENSKVSKGTKEVDLFYTPNNEIRLIVYTDTDWVGSLDDRKKKFIYIFYMGWGLGPNS